MELEFDAVLEVLMEAFDRMDADVICKSKFLEKMSTGLIACLIECGTNNLR